MKKIQLLTIVSSLVLSSVANADWSVTEDSQINYLSTKVFAKSAGSITENNVISGVSGTITKNGKAKIDIDLATLDTAIGIRNERVQKFVFGIPSFGPVATIAAEFPQDVLNQQAAVLDIPATLTVAGVTKDITLHASMHKEGSNIRVVSHRPTIVKGNEFDMAKGFAKLTELAGLGYIPMDIPVSFSITLTPSH